MLRNSLFQQLKLMTITFLVAFSASATVQAQNAPTPSNTDNASINEQSVKPATTDEETSETVDPRENISNAINSGRSYVSLVFENDIFFKDDGGYTNGVGIAWGHGLFERFDKENTPWPLHLLVKHLPINTQEGRHRAISYLVGQMMSTPEDITKPAPEPGDAPYAGLLAGRVTFHSFNAVRTDRLTLVLGMVGPSSGAEDAQSLVHDVTGSENPQGWDTQIKDEPVFRVERSRSDRYWDTAFDNGLEMDLVGTSVGGLGNLSSDIGYGLGLRFGQSLRDSFPTATNLPGREINPTAGNRNQHWMIYMNLLGSYTFNNIMIEGNTFKDSYGAELVHEQLKFSFGAAYNIGKWAFSYTGALSSKQYEAQDDMGKFGSINVTYKLH
ncbi:hypothetical protein TDB9533_00592 [Thalassocella blandensis]|nr:hypothetical protein TDB9533_00592 [Thalassocella blandensis]